MTDPAPSRRDFLKTTSAAGVAAASLATLTPGAYASGSDTLKIGLVGCGGRGTGAAVNALHADQNVELVAVADAFRDRAEASLGRLTRQTAIKDKVKVGDDHIFDGLDGFRHVIDASDVVLLATPPGFRPQHLRAAVEADIHIFTEKPMATDPVGARSVYESVELFKKNNKAMVAGFCWRYDHQKRALFERIHNGEIGDVRAVYGTYLTAPVKPYPHGVQKPEGMSDLEWQVRQWYNFTWLSGDGLVEQAIHTVDWLAWTFGDKPPASCTAVGGRQLPAAGGNIYDHVEVNYVWENGARAFLAQRQIPGCYNQNALYVLGTKGTGKLGRKTEICDLDDKQVWQFSGAAPNMYQNEHDEFFASIRSGKHINDGDRMASSTLMGIMGRIAGYTGKEITWDMALNSKLNLVPDTSQGWDSPSEPPAMARPGFTKFI